MVVKVWPLCRLLHVMEPSDFSDESLIFRLKTKLDQLIASRKYHVFDEDELTNILDELIIYLKGRNNSTSDLLIENQVVEYLFVRLSLYFLIKLCFHNRT